MPKPTEDGQNLIAAPGDTFIDHETGEVYDVILDLQRILHPKEVYTCRQRDPMVCDIGVRAVEENTDCYTVVCRLDPPYQHIFCNNDSNRPDPILFRRRPSHESRG